MGTIIIGSSANRKGITVEPSEVFFNGNVVQAIISGVAEIWSSAKALVPVMTSNTTPYGECSASKAEKSPYLAFDNNDSTYWSATSNELAKGHYLTYKFTTPTSVKKATFKQTVHQSLTATIKYQYSDDGTTWNDAGATQVITDTMYYDTSIPNCGYHLYWRLYFVESTVIATCAHLQFYGKQLVGLVPLMASNTVPYGEAFASSEYNNDYPAWKAFDGVTIHSWLPVVGSGKEDFVGYKFPKPIRAKLVYINYSTENQVFDQAQPYVKVQASDNNSDWIDVSSSVALNKDAKNVSGHLMLEISATKEYTHYRALFSPTICVTGNTSDFMTINTLQFYGDKPLFEPLIPVMTSNTTPSGEASASTETANAGGVGYAYKAFTGEAPNANTGANYWYSIKTTGEWLEYNFEHKVVVKMVKLSVVDTKSGSTMQLKVQAYQNDEWVDISNVKTCTSTGTAMTPEYITCSNNVSSTRIRILRTGGTCEYTALGWVQYYN